MIITHRINTDLIAPKPKPVINAVQSDVYCRKIEITVTAGGVAVEFPEGVSVRGSYRKADGTRGYYDAMPDGTAAGSVAGKVVTLFLAPQVLTCAGTAELVVQLISGETLLNVFPIQINVAALPGFGGNSENYYSVSGLPQITAADNGKVLQVVDGMWVAADPPAGPGVTAVAYVVGDPVEFTIPATAWDGTHCTIKAEGYKAGSDGLYIGLPANDDAVNTQRVVAAALTLPNYTFTAANAEKNTPAYTTLTISSVEAPTEDIKIAVFGLEEVTA